MITSSWQPPWSPCPSHPSSRPAMHGSSEVCNSGMQHLCAGAPGASRTAQYSQSKYANATSERVLADLCPRRTGKQDRHTIICPAPMLQCLQTHRLDDADSDSLAHVAHGEAAQRRVLREGLHAHGLGRNHLHVRGVACCDKVCNESQQQWSPKTSLTTSEPACRKMLADARKAVRSALQSSTCSDTCLHSKQQ